LGENVNSIHRTEALFETIERVGLEVSTEKTWYVVMSSRQNA